MLDRVYVIMQMPLPEAVPDAEYGDLLERFLAKVFRLAIAARCSCRMLCFLAATLALPASDTGP